MSEAAPTPHPSGKTPRPTPPQPDGVPIGTSIAIIMDGNGRWAEQHGHDVTEGHRVGGRALRRTVEAALDLRVDELTVYAFSTENWQRPAGEVTGIMELFVELLTREVPDLDNEGVRMRFIGRHDGLSDRILERMEWAETTTRGNERMTLVIAFNYGGRAEIVDAARAIASKHGVEGITEAAISEALYLPDLRHPDLIIRTAGERRTSNFLVWQGAYSELVFTDVLWPDFGIEPLELALREYAGRDRRFGGRSPSAAGVEVGAS